MNWVSAVLKEDCCHVLSCCQMILVMAASHQARNLRHLYIALVRSYLWLHHWKSLGQSAIQIEFLPHRGSALSLPINAIHHSLLARSLLSRISSSLISCFLLVNVCVRLTDTQLGCLLKVYQQPQAKQWQAFLVHWSQTPVEGYFLLILCHHRRSVLLMVWNTVTCVWYVYQSQKRLASFMARLVIRSAVICVQSDFVEEESLVLYAVDIYRK